ncbi:MAG TPA: LamG-like jellyroll fold domain-containing protein [Pyrinomonadaceae bacterium]
MPKALQLKRQFGRMFTLATALLLAAWLGAFAPASAQTTVETETLSGTCTELPDGLTSWWTADGTAEDFQGNHDGTLMHGAGYGRGVFGQAFTFDGQDDYVRLPDNFFPYPQTGEGGAPFTFAVWFKTTGSGMIIGQHLSNGNPEQDSHPSGWAPGIYVGTDGRLYVEMFWGRSGGTFVSTAVVADGEFHHVAVTYEGPVHYQSIYLDGLLLERSYHSQNGYIEPGTVYKYQFGTGYARNRVGTNNRWFYFNGSIDDPQLYNRALTAAEVSSLYEAREVGGYCSFVISGRVTNVCGQGVPGTQISLSNADSLKSVPVPARTTFTDANGFYRFDHVERGGDYVVYPPASVPHSPSKHFVEDLSGNRTLDFTDLTPVLWCQPLN